MRKIRRLHPDAYRRRFRRFCEPILYPDYKWDFRLPRVPSINASGHKYGLVPPGFGWIVFKDRKVFTKSLYSMSITWVAKLRRRR